MITKSKAMRGIIRLTAGAGTGLALLAVIALMPATAHATVPCFTVSNYMDNGANFTQDMSCVNSTCCFWTNGGSFEGCNSGC
jgi:hypothetical protein